MEQMDLNNKWVSEILATQGSAEGDIFGRPNVVGVGIGQKISGPDRKATGQPCMTIFVTQKVPREAMSPADCIQKTLTAATKGADSILTDVVETGYLFAGPAAGLALAERGAPVHGTLASNGGPPMGFSGVLEPRGTAEIQQLATRVRPVWGGYSVGHKNITAGTIATSVYRRLSGGIGIPPKYYLLSNNHVLADSNAAALGDPILQPGPFDGGTVPGDIVARLSAFVPIQFSPAIPLALQTNLVDAAIAEVAFSNANRMVYWVGDIEGIRPKSAVSIGMKVQKCGRTTHYTTGRIIAINATVDINYTGGKVARFKDQYVSTAMSAGGDSGSLISDLDEKAVGLLFAGSSSATIFNRIELVQNLLDVTVAEQP